jgi:murein DD-endopeptidase MepM/ murein hydrolase activator NlpD
LIILALLAVSAAGCSSETSRFVEGPFTNPFAAKTPPAQGEVTGSIHTATPSKVESQPLPQIGHATGAAQPPRMAAAANGVAGGGKGMASYHPGAAASDITGSVASTPPAQARSWDWDGGTAITVAQGDTIEVISRRYGVPAAAIMQANAITAPASIRPGQRLVIPRYNAASIAASKSTATPSANDVKTAEAGTHVVGPGDTLTKIAHRYHVSLVDIAKANRIEPYAQIKMGDRLVIPGRAAAQPVAAARTEAAIAPQSKAMPAPAQKVAAVEAPHSARVLTPSDTPAADSDAKTADAASPAFRWPVRGRIIAGFGPKTNGQQNDGINLAVPEGTPVKAAEDGVVAYAGNELKGYGNLVLVRHPNGFVTAYAHASELLVKRGDAIKRGQVIARSGQTGTVTSPQLHFEIRKGSAPVDPTQYLTGA